MFRWDQWFKGALVSGFLAAIIVTPSIIKDGLQSLELWIILSSFLGGVGLYCTDHPPKFE